MNERELRSIVQTNIKRYREYREWTQARLAEEMGISINFLSEIENGKKWFSTANMVKFASIFNIEPFELLKPADAPPPAVSALLLRYNDDVVKHLSDSLKQVFRYYYKEPQQEENVLAAEADPQ